MQNKFTEEDKKKVIEFLNFIAKRAKWETNTQECIDYFKLLSFMQQTLLIKIDANILEIIRVVEPSTDEQPKG